MKWPKTTLRVTHAHVGGDAAQHQVADTATPQQQVQIWQQGPSPTLWVQAAGR